MSSAKPPREFPEDLSIRARRDSISLGEQQLLAQRLAASVTLRVAHEVGRDFDRLSAVRSGDDDLVARSFDAVMARRAALPRGPAGRLRWALLAAALCVPLLAGAAGSAWLGRASTPQPLERGRAPASAPDKLPGPGLGGSSDTASPVTPLALRAAARASDAGVLPPGAELEPPKLSPRSESSLVAPETTAAELFRRASLARREGRLSQARAAFSELQRRFPESEEARLSRVSLGKLLLTTGDADQALRQFDGYLGAGNGALAEEALVGRAQSLARLGRTGDERHVWRELLNRYPRSVYAVRARQRLAELGAAKP